MPKDRVTLQHQGYGFVEFISEEDADYSIRIMNMIKVNCYFFINFNFFDYFICLYLWVVVASFNSYMESRYVLTKLRLIRRTWMSELIYLLAIWMLRWTKSFFMTHFLRLELYCKHQK